MYGQDACRGPSVLMTVFDPPRLLPPPNKFARRADGPRAHAGPMAPGTFSAAWLHASWQATRALHRAPLAFGRDATREARSAASTGSSSKRGEADDLHRRRDRSDA